MTVSPTRPKGPPLNAMRAFEAAARHGSFTLAASELGVTAGAVSQHVKTLEDWTGTALFLRRSRDVVLTKAGQALAPTFSKAFDGIGDAIHAVKGVRPTQDVHIATLPGIAQLWLSKRLRHLRQTLKDVQFSVTALEHPPNLRRDLFDISLFLQDPTDTANTRILEKDVIFPVCTPELAKNMQTPDDVLGHTRLVDQSWASDWDQWSKSVGLKAQNQTNVARYSLYSLALEEAKAGAGVLMGHLCLVQSALDAGDLVRPFPQIFETGKALVLQTAPYAQKRIEVQNTIDLLATPNSNQ